MIKEFLRGYPTLGRLIMTEMTRSLYTKEGELPPIAEVWYSKIIPVGCKHAHDVIITEHEMSEAERRFNAYYPSHDKRYFRKEHNRGVAVEFELNAPGSEGFNRGRFYKTPGHKVKLTHIRFKDGSDTSHFCLFDKRTIERMLERAYKHPEGIYYPSFWAKVAYSFIRLFRLYKRH